MLNISLSTLLLQAANFLIVAYILARFLFIEAGVREKAREH